MGITEDLWKKTKKIDFGSELDHAKEEAMAWKTIWSAGQGVTSISDLGVEELNVTGISTFASIILQKGLSLVEITGSGVNATGVVTETTVDAGIVTSTNLYVTGVSTMSTVDIEGGSIDGTPIGFYHRSNGMFVDVDISRNLDVDDQTESTSV